LPFYQLNQLAKRFRAAAPIYETVCYSGLK
jgi:hypothetical protein